MCPQCHAAHQPKGAGALAACTHSAMMPATCMQHAPTVSRCLPLTESTRAAPTRTLAATQAAAAFASEDAWAAAAFSAQLLQVVIPKTVVDLNHSKLGLPALYFQHNCMISFICLNTSSFAEQQSCSTAYHLQHAPTVPCCPPTKEADAPATCTHSASPTHLGPSPHLPSNRAAQTSLGGRRHTLLVATLPTLLHQHPAAQWGKGPEPCTANPCALQGGAADSNQLTATS